jgi:hypothetical protein
LRDEPPSKRRVSAQQFCSVAMASKSTGTASIAVATVADGSSGGGGWAGPKIGNDVFRTEQIQYLHIELGDESQMALLLWQNGGRTVRQSSHKRFVICPQLEGATFAKMAKMPDCCLCSQQVTIKHGVIRLHVGQFSGKETKWSSMVSRFLLHDVLGLATSQGHRQPPQYVIFDTNYRRGFLI